MVSPFRRRSLSSQHGNILVYVLIGIILIGLLTAALRLNGNTGDIDRERYGIKATEVQRYAASVQQAVTQILQNGVSEADLRFASPKADALNGSTTHYGTFDALPANNKNQVFHPSGGNAEYKLPPAGVQDPLKPWEFLGLSNMPQVGSDKADLIMVLPSVTKEFCTEIDKQLGFKNLETTFPSDPGSCFYAAGDANRFAGTFSASPNTLDEATFSRLPAQQACVSCSGRYHYYYVLLAR